MGLGAGLGEEKEEVGGPIGLRSTGGCAKREG